MVQQYGHFFLRTSKILGFFINNLHIGFRLCINFFEMLLQDLNSFPDPDSLTNSLLSQPAAISSGKHKYTFLFTIYANRGKFPG
jgi:hypothetical protein